jgi:hypothetical protein
MSFRLSPFSVGLLSLFLITQVACKKHGSPATGSTGPGGSNDSTPAITAIGTPIGSPVTKNIDASGGSLTSPDGKLALVIPSGALSAGTAISIQPVTNTAPGGLGSAYQLLPEGIKFSKAVTITYHYADSDVRGSLPYFLYIAYQDSARSWKTDLKQRALDTIAKTVSITSTHFSIWSAFVDIVLLAGKEEYHESDTSHFEVTEILRHGTKAADEGDDDLYSLPVNQALPDNVVGNWSLNGAGPGTLSFGNITGSGAHILYKAPALIESETQVQVSVEVTFKEAVFSYSSGKQIATFNKLILYHPITLLSNELEYTLTLEIGDSHPSQDPTGYGYTYTDHAIADITIENTIIGNNVKVSNIQNFEPGYSITAGTSCKILSVYPDPVGELHITNGYGEAGAKTFNVNLLSAGGRLIKYDYQCDCQNCPVQTNGGSDAGNQGYGTPFWPVDNITHDTVIGDLSGRYTKWTLKPK